MKAETRTQSLKRIEDVIYSLPYDCLDYYLQGARDVINLLNGTKNNKEVADSIIKQIEYCTY